MFESLVWFAWSVFVVFASLWTLFVVGFLVIGFLVVVANSVLNLKEGRK